MTSRRRRTGRRLPGTIAALTLLVSAAGGSRAGAVLDRIDNPATPAEGTTEVALRELWRLGGAEAFDLVSSAFLDRDGNVCLLDPVRRELRVYDSAGARVRTIAPGDSAAARSPSAACALTRGGYVLLQALPGVVQLYGPRGRPTVTLAPRLPDVPPPDSARSTFTLVSVRATPRSLVVEGLLESSMPMRRELDRRHVLGLFDFVGRLDRLLLSDTQMLDVSLRVLIDERTVTRYEGRWTTGPDGRIYAAPELYDYAIEVFDPAGRPTRVIAREYARLTRTPEERDRTRRIFEAFARNDPRAVVEVEPDHADIQEIFAAADSTLWVLSSQGRYRASPGVLGVYDVFDARGRFVRQTALRGEGDPAADGVWLLGDRVIVARNLIQAALARLEGEPPSEGPKVVVVCYAR
jgi:hypothetical protein